MINGPVKFLTLVPIKLFLGILVILLNLLCLPVLGLAEGKVRSASSETTSKPDGDFSITNLEKDINDLDAQIHKLREQSVELQEKTRVKLQAQLDILRKQRDVLVPQIEKLKDSGERAWQDLKENIQKLIEELKSSNSSIN